MADRKHNILMRYRGAGEELERALSSGPHAVKDYLDQFEGDERLGAALAIAGEIGVVIREELPEGETVEDYVAETANPGVLRGLAGGAEGLRWSAGVAGVAEDMCQPIKADER